MQEIASQASAVGRPSASQHPSQSVEVADIPKPPKDGGIDSHIVTSTSTTCEHLYMLTFRDAEGVGVRVGVLLGDMAGVLDGVGVTLTQGTVQNTDPLPTLSSSGLSRI